VSWVVLALALGAGPSEWVLPGVRVHVVASEDLDPDRLRALARPEVVLWIRTRSNGLRRSTVETLHDAGAAFVQVRPPLGAPSLAPFSGRVGPWVEERGLDASRAGRWSPGRLAVDLEGPLTEELAARIGKLRPAAVVWRRGGWPGPDEWVRARALSGVELVADAAGDCGSVPRRARVRVRLPLGRRQEHVCGLPVRLEVPATVDLDQIREVFLTRADVDLLTDVGDDPALAGAARRWIEALAAATPTGAAKARAP